jgi:ATP synthase protein I
MAAGAADETAEPEFKPLSAQEAQALLARLDTVSPWRVLAWQVMGGSLVVLAAWLLTGSMPVLWSVLYGVLAVVLPNVVLARGMARGARVGDARARVMKSALAFFIWEGAKVALTVAMLFAAPRLVGDLSWPALLVGLVLTMKMMWVAWLVRPKRGI